MLRIWWELFHLFIPTNGRDTDLWKWFPDRWRLLNQRWGCTSGRQEAGAIQRQRGTNSTISHRIRVCDWAGFLNILLKQRTQNCPAGSFGMVMWAQGWRGRWATSTGFSSPVAANPFLGTWGKFHWAGLHLNLAISSHFISHGQDFVPLASEI